MQPGQLLHEHNAVVLARQATNRGVADGVAVCNLRVATHDAVPLRLYQGWEYLAGEVRRMSDVRGLARAAFKASATFNSSHGQAPTNQPPTPTTRTATAVSRGDRGSRTRRNGVQSPVLLPEQRPPTCCDYALRDADPQRPSSGHGIQSVWPGLQRSQYDTPPQIRNPFAPPPTASSAYAAQNAGFDPDHEAQIAQWQAQYAPVDQQLRGKKIGKEEVSGNANLAPLGQRGAATGAAAAEADQKEDKYTVVRKGGGEQWEDQSLLQWDPNKFRIMVGNLAGEVTDDSLAKAFAAYGVSKARVVRDKRTTKSKGFGFVEFEEGELGFKAAREMVGKYIGSHPVTIQRSKTDVRPQTKKDNNKYKGKNARNNDKNKDKKKKNDNDPLKAHTGAGIEKKPSKTTAGLKLLG
ncbi:hypothetical protein BST61_g10543 [Cercospora zeina]